MMSKKISRRTLLRGMAATAACSGALPLLAQAQEVPEAAKLSKDMAKYQPTPNGEKRCDNCIQFIAEDNTCRVVKGEVAPEGYCALWAPQANT